MATVKNSIELQDKMSKKLNGLINKIQSTQNAMNRFAKDATFNDLNMQHSLEYAKAGITSFMQTEGLAIEQTRKLGNTVGKTSGVFDKLRKSLIAQFSIGAIIASLVMSGIYALGNLVKSSIQTAAAIVEVQNVINVAYQGSTKAVDDWAKHTLDAYGINELNAKKYAGTMAAMLESSGLTIKTAGNMSMKLVGLAGDLASFYNIGTDAAFKKIRSGMAGMVMPLRQLGIDMTVATLQTHAYTMGIHAKWKALSQAQKELVRYDYLMKVSAAIQGDFQRTYLSFANQQRLVVENWQMFTAHLANFFLPIMALGLLAINKTIKAMYGIGQVIKFLMPYVIALGVAFLVSQLPAIGAAIAGWALWAFTAMQTAAIVAGAWLIANWPVALVIAGIIAVVAIMQHMGITFHQVCGFAGGVFAGLGAAIGNVVIGIRKMFMSLASFVLSLLGMMAKNIDDVFGSHLQDGINTWKKGVDEANKNTKFYNVGKAYNKGSRVGEQFGKNVEDKLGQLFKQPNFGIGKGGFDANGGAAGANGKGSKGNPIYTKLDDNDIKALVEVAKVNYVNKFVKLRPELNAYFGDVHENADVGGLMTSMANMMEQAYASDLSGGK